MNTALQQLIEYATTRRNNSRLMYLPADEYAMDAIILKATELLEVERKQIEDSHDKANENWEKGYPTPITSGDVYFATNFKQQQF